MCEINGWYLFRLPSASVCNNNNKSKMIERMVEIECPLNHNDNNKEHQHNQHNHHHQQQQLNDVVCILFLWGFTLLFEHDFKCNFCVFSSLLIMRMITMFMQCWQTELVLGRFNRNMIRRKMNIMTPILIDQFINIVHGVSIVCNYAQRTITNRVYHHVSVKIDQCHDKMVKWENI